jgi:HSP20 family protein
MKTNSAVPAETERSVLARETNPFVMLQQEIDRLFSDFNRGYRSPAAIVPRMDVSETDKTIELTAELPGLEENDVEINFTDGVLTIRGEKKSENQKDTDYRLVERSYGVFSRALELPPGIDPTNIQASLVNGVLTVTVPKPAASVTKKIELNVAA